MENHSKVNFENSYNSLPETFFKRVKPEKMPDVGLFLLNQKLSDRLDFDYSWLKKKDGIQFLSGQNLIKDSEPIALAYAGHQFGSFVPQLGDGRAILLGEVKDKNGNLKNKELVSQFIFNMLNLGVNNPLSRALIEAEDGVDKLSDMASTAFDSFKKRTNIQKAVKRANSYKRAL